MTRMPSEDTLWLCQNSYWSHGPVEIVDYPLKMVMFHNYVSLPEGIWSLYICISCLDSLCEKQFTAKRLWVITRPPHQDRHDDYLPTLAISWFFGFLGHMLDIQKIATLQNHFNQIALSSKQTSVVNPMINHPVNQPFQRIILYHPSRIPNFISPVAVPVAVALPKLDAKTMAGSPLCSSRAGVL